MREINIPTRPKNDTEFGTIKKADKELLSYVVAMHIPHETAFLRWHPEFMDASGRLNKSGKQACGQFFRYNKNKAYMDAYAETLAEAMGGSTSVNESIEEITEERKSDAVKAYLLNVIKVLKDGDIKDPDTIKILTDIVNKVGWLKSDAEQIMKPIRVLMTRCGECRYRIGVESAVLNGEILDMCAYCKARKCAEEHGYRFNDGKDLLDIPKEVIAELESKNNVKLEQILQGKIEN